MSSLEEQRAVARAQRKAKRAAGKEGPEDKSLRIATGVLKRLVKELAYNHKEIAKQKEKIEKYSKDPAYDQSRLPQERAVLAESEAMVPEVQKKIEVAREKLEALLSDEAFVAKVTKGLEDAKQLLASK